MKPIAALSLQNPSLNISDFKILSEAFHSSVPVQDWFLCGGLSAGARQYFELNAIPAWTSALDLCKFCEDREIEILYPGHPLYSAGFYELEDPPLFLTLEGRWPGRRSLAIVGSREPSRFAVDWMTEHLPIAFSGQEWLIVSGGARGIDLTAHLTAVKCNQPTLVFLPSGLQNVYPPDLVRWKKEIMDSGGGFVSELHPLTEMRKHHFLKRNRLIVAASDLVFVVEARRRSGSMLTAKLATNAAKDVCTLPCSPNMTCAQGSLDLLFDGGASLIRDAQDLTALFGSSSTRVARLVERQLRTQSSQATFQSME